MRLPLRRRVNFAKNLMFEIRAEKEAWRLWEAVLASKIGPRAMLEGYERDIKKVYEKVRARMVRCRRVGGMAEAGGRGFRASNIDLTRPAPGS